MQSREQWQAGDSQGCEETDGVEMNVCTPMSSEVVVKSTKKAGRVLMMTLVPSRN